MSFDSRVVAVGVGAPSDAVYRYARTMEHLPLWASGLATGVSEENGAWFTESPMGRVKVAMAPDNAFGVLDHDVTLPDGTVVHNALRVTPSGSGCLLTFVVLRLPDTDDTAFEADVAHVTCDLHALKRLMEGDATV